MIDAADRSDAGAFLVRLVRLDPGAVVRLRPLPSGGAEMWAMLPFKVLVMRTLTTPPPSDVTVSAADLLENLADPVKVRRRDEAWRWPVPSSRGRVIEVIPGHEVTRVAAAAAKTLRDAATEGVGGRAVGERVIRDALLDHVPIVVTGESGERVDVPQRMVQAMVRMGFLGRVTGPAPPVSVTFGDGSPTITAGDSSVTVRLAMGWIGLDGSYGSAWYRPMSPLRLS